MKASELIEILESLIDSHGDCAVFMTDGEDFPEHRHVNAARMNSSSGSIRFVIQ